MVDALDTGRTLHVLDYKAEAGGYTPMAFSGDWASCALITRRVSLSSGERLVAYRLSDTVYLEAAQ